MAKKNICSTSTPRAATNDAERKIFGKYLDNLLGLLGVILGVIRGYSSLGGGGGGGQSRAKF